MSGKRYPEEFKIEAVKQITGLRNIILGMGLAMPPALIKATADALKAGHLNPIDLYYMHGTYR